MHRFSSLIFIASGLLVIFFSLVGNHSLIQLIAMHSEARELRDKNIEIETEILDVSAEIAGLRLSQKYLESEIRQSLGMADPEEVVYLYSDN